MAYISPFWHAFRKAVLIPGAVTLTYLFALLALLVPVQVFLPAGLPWGSNKFLTGFGVFMFILLPLIIAATACLAVAFLIGRRQKAVFRRLV
jgi:hypothetical protein